MMADTDVRVMLAKERLQEQYGWEKSLGKAKEYDELMRRCLQAEEVANELRKTVARLEAENKVLHEENARQKSQARTDVSDVLHTLETRIKGLESRDVAPRRSLTSPSPNAPTPHAGLHNRLSRLETQLGIS